MAARCPSRWNSASKPLFAAPDPGYAYAAHRAALRMLGFESDAASFERQFAKGSDKADAIAAMFRSQRGLRIPCTPIPGRRLDGQIMGQQISLQAAVTLRRGLIQALGLEPLKWTKGVSSADAIAAVDVEFLRGLKFSPQKRSTCWLLPVPL